MQPLLSVQNLEMTYADGTKALTGISFDVHEGTFIAIIGPSNAGKSPFLRSTNRLVSPINGEILYKDESILQANKKHFVSYVQSLA